MPNIKKSLLIYAHYYIPDVASTGQICADLAEGLSYLFDVTVICAVPSYSGKVSKDYENKKEKVFFEEIKGVHVVRIAVPNFNKKSKLSRIRNILSYYFRAKSVTRKLKQFDYVFSISQPPVLGGMLGLFGAKLKKAKFIYNIQDINPEQILAVGYNKSKLATNVLLWLDKRTCLGSDLIITVGRDLVRTLNNRFLLSKKKPKNIVMINNWIDDKKIYPLPQNDAGVVSFKETFGLENKFVIMYSGNLGLYYDLEGIIKTIGSIQENIRASDGREVVFVFIGSGVLEEKLKKYKEVHQLTNIIFIPYQNQDSLIYSLNSADVHLCLSAKGIKGVSCPSKFYGIAACSKPVLAVMDNDSEIGQIIGETKCGFLCNPGDYESIKENMIKCLTVPHSQLARMGENGFLYLQSNLTKQKAIEKYANTIKDLL